MEDAFYRGSRGWTVEEIVEPVNGADVIARVIVMLSNADYATI